MNVTLIVQLDTAASQTFLSVHKDKKYAEIENRLVDVDLDTLTLLTLKVNILQAFGLIPKQDYQDDPPAEVITIVKRFRIYLDTLA